MGVDLSAAEQAALLGTHGTCVLATTRPDSVPVPLPVWYVVIEDRVYIRTPRATKRLEHISHNPRVGLLVHGGEAWRDLRGVLINGRAIIVEGDEARAVHDVVNERFADLMPPPLPDAVASHYADTAIVRIDPVGMNRTWDNRKIRLPH